MKILRPVIGLVLMLAMSGSPGCKKEEPQQMPPAPIVTGKSTTADVPVYRNYPAKTQSERTMPINARVEGILERKVYEQGSLVVPGQILYVIQPEPFKAERDAAQAELASAIADFNYSKSQVDRNSSLVEQGAISKEYYDELKAKLVAAEARIDSAKASLVQAELNLSYCSVAVPDVDPAYVYRIGDTYFDEGTLVGPAGNSELATVVQISPIRTVFDPAGSEWPEYLSQIKAGQTPLSVEVTIPSDKSFTRTGNINFIDNMVDPNTSTVEMWARIDNDDFALMPGQYVSVRVLLRTLKDAVVIPSKAVQSKAGEKFIWTLEDGKTPVQVNIELGPSHGEQVVVTRGLKPGVNMIVEGGARVRPGVELLVVSAKEFEDLNKKNTGQPTAKPSEGS
ncbi:MAG: hypothetical protein CMJ40_08305 [Phycisphaerae bacterium]|nr:hypothetical protein [Phycisphaerae bacterium]